ncbi:hypothetical protein BC938DRAFT_484000 [Jimgerdemannia flammicorona]|uniref:Uncharacterized protein n=1 Tax=Jimgerdemannia flammicorona TaxID=994334 RepID=A0A433QAX7_9FUNG|nr:hypothetical protein BC938DRAFT_484000 [Jimgerdemannia flammicorona]
MGTRNAPFKGPNKNLTKEKRVQKRAFKARRMKTINPVIIEKPLSKKKQQQITVGMKHALRRLAATGKYVPEEEMKDAFAISEVKSTKSITVELSPEVLALSAAGPGTTLGAPR